MPGLGISVVFLIWFLFVLVAFCARKYDPAGRLQIQPGRVLLNLTPGIPTEFQFFGVLPNNHCFTKDIGRQDQVSRTQLKDLRRYRLMEAIRRSQLWRFGRFRLPKSRFHSPLSTPLELKTAVEMREMRTRLGSPSSPSWPRSQSEKDTFGLVFTHP